MTTVAKIVANRLNALASTGPRTPEGKAKAAQNARKHGLFSQAAVLPDEDLDEYNRLNSQIRSDLRPATPIEHELVEIIISTLWRMRRALKIESGLISMYRVYQNQDGGVGCAFAHDASQLACFQRLSRYEVALERRLFRTLREFQEIRAARPHRRRDETPTFDVLNPVGEQSLVINAVADSNSQKKGFWRGFFHDHFGFLRGQGHLNG